MLAEVLSRNLFQKVDRGASPIAQVGVPLGAYLNKGLPKKSPDEDAINFYMLNHAFGWLRSIKHVNAPFTELEQEFMDLYVHNVTDIGIRAYYYLYVIICRELRHLSPGSTIGVVKTKFGSVISSLVKSIDGSDSTTVVDLIQKPLVDAPLGDFIRAIEYCYNAGNWKGGYGGAPWGRIANCLLSFVEGTQSLEMMTDTVWTLAHNNGPIFNKPYIYSGYTSDLVRVLDVQRSGQIPQLVCDHNVFSNKYLSESPLSSDSVLTMFQWIKKCLPGCTDFFGHVDWFKVEALGAVHGYKKQQGKQEGLGIPSDYKDHVTSKAVPPKVPKGLTKAPLAHPIFQQFENSYQVNASTYVKKIKREEVHA